MDINYIFEILIDSISKYEYKENFTKEINKSLKYIETHMYNANDFFDKQINDNFIKDLILLFFLISLLDFPYILFF